MNTSQSVNELLEKAQEVPWNYSFFKILRFIEAKSTDKPRIGKSLLPSEDFARLSQIPSLIFAPREIAKIDLNRDKPEIFVFGLGMFGPNGFLPIHITEIIRDDYENRKDSTMVDFFNIFHHRYLSHLYRAHAQARPTHSLDRKDDEQFSRYVGHLIGIDTTDHRNEKLPLHALLSFATHISKATRTPESLERVIYHYFNIPIKVEEYALNWLPIEEKDHATLGGKNRSTGLGTGHILGAYQPDRQTKFKIKLGPMSLKDYMRFTPKGADIGQLIDIVRSFVGIELAWEIELTAAASEAHPVNTSHDDQLGWSTWLGVDEQREHAIGMVFDPEAYAKDIFQVSSNAVYENDDC